jgi:hypothetical protein
MADRMSLTPISSVSADACKIKRQIAGETLVGRVRCLKLHQGQLLECSRNLGWSSFWGLGHWVSV